MSSSAKSEQMQRLWANPDYRERALKTLAICTDKTRHLDQRTLIERGVRISRALRARSARLRGEDE